MQAIVESEPFGIYMRSRNDADEQGAKFAKALGEEMSQLSENYTYMIDLCSNL